MVDEAASIAEGIGEAWIDVWRGGSLHNRRRNGWTEGSASRINCEINLLKSTTVDNIMLLIVWIVAGADY